MLEKIIKIENIKQWQHKRALAQSFNKLNLIYGRNGSGKSTLCKLFDSINQNDLASIQALQPIESVEKQALELRIDSNNITLNSLQTPYKFQIFNQLFIDNNLYISNSKDRKQLSNYYDFSLGNVSVEKEREIESLKDDNVNITIELSPINARFSTQFPSKTPSQIRNIKKFSNAEDEIIKLRAQLDDLKSIQHFKKRKILSKLILEKPKLSVNVFTIDIQALSKNAEDRVNEHISKNLKEKDKYWIETGVTLVTESNNCPFCAQSLAGSTIFSLYQEFINESYVNASSQFELDSDKFELSVSDIGVNIENLEELISSNNEVIQEWSDKIKKITLTYDFSKLDKLSTDLWLECSKLIKNKKKDLLSQVDLARFDEIFDEIFNEADFSNYNKLVSNFNSSISEFLNGLAVDTTQSIQSKIDNAEESQLRYSSEIVDDLAEHKRLSDTKNKNTIKIKELRNEIDTEQEESIKHNKKSINNILKNFHSMIRLKELVKDNKGKNGVTRLKYVITFINNDLSVLDDSQNQNIFERVLSLGDRSALALAFFLSRFSKENNDKSIIVLDDPMSSLDNYRKDATIIEIAKLIEHNYQTFVLSHDPFFLSDTYKHSILSKDTQCFEIEVQYNDINPLDPDSSKYISSKLAHKDNYDSYVLHSYLKEYNKLWDFVTTGSEDDKVEVARSIRPILEAYLRFLYPRHFVEGLWLGDMISKIRTETDVKSCYYDKHGKFGSIAKINEFSKDYHHAEGFDTRIQGLDFQTVQSYAKETLQFITGL
ncbi:AAA family ATPase [Rahnella contaminans]|uniref:AAA family ATPase n=1 Tax=Rahnella contaminans TaxID=2703882 RepID=UPI0023DBAC64|nr:AAA family ATPase [Rahnella contaminans]MDF1892682.1 AAA family ATPase [Rahnella contaminans]